MAKTKKTEPNYKYSIVNGVGLENVHSVNGRQLTNVSFTKN